MLRVLPVMLRVLPVMLRVVPAMLRVVPAMLRVLPPVMPRAVAASRKSQQNSLSGITPGGITPGISGK